jgi:hypothetical protein
MPTDLTNAAPDVVLANRENVVYTARKHKLFLNTLALDGGRPYVNTRLSRFPGESTIDWQGTQAVISKSRFADTSSKVEGRKTRAYLVNNAARVAEKIRQYVFAKHPERGTANPELRADITRQGDSVNAFMGDVLKQLIATKWCWIGIDAPNTEGIISLAQARNDKIRPYWHLYEAEEVVDWNFDDKGELVWLMTETEKWTNDNPEVFEQPKIVRRLWKRGFVTEYVLETSVGTDNSIVPGSEVTVQLGIDEVPFVLAGAVSGKPHWYDDVEDIQRASLDLESSMDTLFFKTVFAQMVLPQSLTEEATSENSGTGLVPTVEALVGLSNAITEAPEDKGITRYIGPDSTSLKVMQGELGRKREELFDVVGLHLNFSKNFSESADAKHFDNLDPQAVLRNYAQQIAEAEAKAWAMTAKLDGSVQAIVPTYSDKFRVSNIYEDFKSLVLADNMDLPESVKRLNIHGVVDTLLEITDMQLTDDQRNEINKEIDEMDFSDEIIFNPASLAGKTVAGVAKQATDDGEGVRDSGALVDE